MEGLVHLCDKAHSLAECKVVALACILVVHCLRRQEAGGSGGEAERDVKFFAAKSRGEQEQELGPLVVQWLKFLCKLQAL